MTRSVCNNVYSVELLTLYSEIRFVMITFAFTLYSHWALWVPILGKNHGTQSVQPRIRPMVLRVCWTEILSLHTNEMIIMENTKDRIPFLSEKRDTTIAQTKNIIKLSSKKQRDNRIISKNNTCIQGYTGTGQLATLHTVRSTVYITEYITIQCTS